MEETLYPCSKKCKECGKEIYPGPEWVYKKNRHYYCSWKCYRAEDKRRESIIGENDGE